MRVHTLQPLLAALLGALGALGGCAGCSEECSGDNQGAETCPCSSDQDCTTRLGTVLLCVDGACAVDDPPAPTELAACDDGACAEGLACGVDDVCFAAPRCQRIDVALSFRLADGSAGPVTAAVDGCAHAWSADAGGGGSFDAAIASIGLDGAMALDGCDDGHWYAADRVGELVCDGVRWAVAPADVTPCVNDCAAPCRLARDGARTSESVGVCP